MRINEIIDLKLNMYFEVNNIFYAEDFEKFNIEKRLPSNLFNYFKDIEFIHSSWSFVLNLAYFYSSLFFIFYIYFLFKLNPYKIK